MKKLLLFILCFMMSLNSFANASGNQELIQIFDDYQYAVTVDWDQKDEKKLAELTDALYKNLDKLTLGKGINPKDIESLITSRVQNPAAVEIAKLKLRILGPNPSSLELAKFLKEEGKNFYAQGASWNGEVVPLVGFGVFFIGIIAYAIWFHSTHECVSYREEREETCWQDFDRPWEWNCSYDTYQVCAEWVKK